MKFTRKSQLKELIPTSSMADIAFLLLIFFMVTTVFRVYHGLDVLLPRAEATQKIETKRNLCHVWVDTRGQISIDDMLVEVPLVYPVVLEKMRDNPRIIISMKADKQARYGVLADVMEELKRAQALRINFATDREVK
jgi:biopolymer transport protein ExbD